MAIHAEYLWNCGEPAGASPIGVCVEGKCGAELQICGVDPAEVLANLERACGHWCEENYGPYVPDCPTYLPTGTYRLCCDYVPPECAIIAIRHIECDSVVVNAGCPPLTAGDGGGTGGGTCTVTGPIDVTIIGPDPINVAIDGVVEVTGTVGIEGTVDVTGDVTVSTAPGTKLDMNLCAISADLPPIPVIITNQQPQTDFEYVCASDDGRVLVSVTTVTDGVASTVLLEADGITPAPAGVVAGTCAGADWESLGPKIVCVRGIADQYMEGFCIHTLVNTADPSETITVMLDDTGAVVEAGQWTVVPCQDGSCPSLTIIPDVVTTTTTAIAANAYGYVCIEVPCFKRTVEGGMVTETEVPDDSYATVTWDNGQVDIVGKGEKCCRDARGLCPLTGQPRTIANGATVEVVSGEGACAVISGDV